MERSAKRRAAATERVVLVSPRGYCAGVVRAIATVERALAILPRPVYVRRAIVHNTHVVQRLAAAGATFVNELSDVPRGSVVVLSAHGVAPSVRAEASERRLRVVDGTCPLVLKVHREARRFVELGFEVLLVGHAGHDEVVATLGQGPGIHLIESRADALTVQVVNPERVACITQTTLSPHDVRPVLDRLRARFPAMVEPVASDVCYATRNRQGAVAWLARMVDLVLVVGDPTSSNSRRLAEVAIASGTPAHLVGGAAEVDDEWLIGPRVVGISAGASTPEDVVTSVVDYLSRDGAVVERTVFTDERVSFALPPELTVMAAAPAD